MAIRNLRYDTDPVLHKVSKEVEVIDEKIKILVKDMFETMEKYYGVGLAAPQVGILKRVIVIDTGEPGERLALINPVIKDMKGEFNPVEGCLSYPGLYARVKRKEVCTVEYTNLEGERKTVTGKGLLAQAFQHEIDHLNGIVFTDLVENEDSYFTYDKNDKEVKAVYNEKLHKTVRR